MLLTIWSWEAVWVTEHIEPMPPMYHTGCGGEFHPVLHCSACRRELHGSQIQVGGDPPKAR